MAIWALISISDDLPLFLVGVWFFVYLPGRWWGKWLRLSSLDSFLASLLLGLVQFTLGQFFFGLLGWRWLAYGLSGVLAVLSLLHQGLKREIPFRSWQLSRLTWLILVFGVLGQSSLIFTSGLKLADGRVAFTDYRDTLWHLALMEELAAQVPPLHPGFAGTILTHYHFLTDLFFGSLLAVLPLDRLDFLFRIIPLFLSSLFGLTLVSLARNLLKGGENWLLVFAYFSGSLAWILPWLFGVASWGDSSFWVSQTFAMLLNPPLALSLSLVSFTAVLLKRLVSHWSWPLELAVVLLTGSLIGFKVYGAIVVLAGLLGFGLSQLWSGRLPIFRLGFLSAVLAGGVFLPTNSLGFSGSFLIWAPGWFLRAMVENQDRVYLPKLVLAEETLRAGGGYLGLFRLKLSQLLTFLIGNFGVRTFGLVGIWGAWRNWGQSIFAYWFGIIFAGVVFPLLFIQKGSVANTIQTFYYALIGADLLAAQGLVNLFKKSYFQKPLVKVGLTLVILALAVPTNLKLIWESVQAKPRLVSAQEMLGYDYLQKLPRAETLILVPPTKPHLDAIWVGALANQRTVYSDRLMAENTLQPFAERESQVTRFFQDDDPAFRREFLRKFGVTHLVLVGEERQSFSPGDLSLVKIVDNQAITVFKVAS